VEVLEGGFVIEFYLRFI